ncbi:hypothetical protein C1645_749553 [Glomus cerebriforme]|uniref:Tetraspanin family-domain-containing protein n=1 Tax=Glomus cerebriforme TaxID=658196 RepID=A0A397TUC4_9GLOM|nr:hypothetical protein C1645_749553 [Glomus cerebriforme]
MVDCCLCCIPVRLGTIILAIISLVVAIFGAIGYLGKPDELLVGFPHGISTLFGLLFILMGLISVFGIIGSCFSSPGAVKLFEWMLWGFVVAFAIIAGVTIYSSIVNKQIAIDRCVAELQGETDKTLGGVNDSNSNIPIVNGITNSTTGAINDKISGNFPEICKERERVKIWSKVISSIFITLFGAYFAGVTSRFADELHVSKSRSISNIHPTTPASRINLSDTKHVPITA